MRADLLLDARLLQHPPQIGPRRLGGHRLLARRAGEYELPTGRVLPGLAERQIDPLVAQQRVLAGFERQHAVIRVCLNKRC